MKVVAIITAAGIGKRMGTGTPKQFLEISDRPILLHTLEKFNKSKYIELLVITTEPSMIAETEEMIKKADLSKKWMVVAGGKERQDSVQKGLNALPSDTDIVVVHDGVRPFIEPELIDSSVEIAEKDGGCIVAIPVSDTVKLAKKNDFIKETVDRKSLWAAQTPQTFKYEILKKAFDEASNAGYYGTDEASLVERIGLPVKLLNGSRKNIKITAPEDMDIAEAICGHKTAESPFRIGVGYDLHRLVVGRKLILGGVEIPYSMGLLGHSDADALLHAIADAILGAAALGDIGKHFPDTDPKFKGADSRKLLKAAVNLAAQKELRPTNVDAMLIVERPKMAPHIDSMRKNIAEDLGLDINSISVKATTNEGTGLIGNGEAIAAQAIVLMTNSNSSVIPASTKGGSASGGKAGIQSK